jgi:hypothetical protein
LLRYTYIACLVKLLLTAAISNNSFIWVRSHCSVVHFYINT